jgi:hypothetical protein
MSVKDGSVFDLILLEESEEGISLNMSMKGVVTEESTFTAGFESEEMIVDIRHENIGKIASKAFHGDMKVSFYDEAKLLKTCTMTLRPGEHVRYEIVDHMSD